ncbi:MAG: CoA pyrophosphatase [Planctomycetes bacterium]|nr:CoA pyrophosphatase [Planctomycetota bacterium]
MPDAALRQAAVAVVCVPAGVGLEVLLIRRAERAGDPWSGQMGLPGGHRDELDRDLLHTVIRETEEELGFDLRRARALGALDELQPVIRPMTVRPYVFALDARPVLALGPEVASARWARLDELGQASSITEVFHRGELRTMPCYRLGEDIVWGMTYRVLQPLVAAV